LVRRIVLRRVFSIFLILIVMLIVGPATVSGSNGQMQWSKTYGGSGDESASFVIQTSDGGYVIAGGNLLVRTDLYGNILWQKTYTGSIATVVQTSVGYAIAGTLNNLGFILDLSSTGVPLYDPPTTFSQPLSIGSQISDMILAPDGYVLAGSTTMGGTTGSQVWIVKIDFNRNVIWSYDYTGYRDQWGKAIVSTGDGYAIAGEANNGPIPGMDMFLVKTHLDGTLWWTKSYAGPHYMYGQYASSIAVTSDGGLVLAGYEDYNGGDFFLVKKVMTGASNGRGLSTTEVGNKQNL
jgi:hypothetical protein